MRRRSLESSVWVQLIVVGAACGDKSPGGGTETSSGAASSTGVVPIASTGDVPTTSGAESSTSAASGLPASSSTTGTDSNTIIFDVGTMVDLPVDNTTGELIDWDCDELVQPFVSERELFAPRGYHDVFFNDDGHILGWDGASLIASTYDDMSFVFLPGVNDIQGIDVLENGDALWESSTGVHRVTPDQDRTVLNGAVAGGYGLTIGPDQKAYVMSGGIWRVDPESGEAAIWHATPGLQPRSLVFNLDSTGVYFSTLFGGNNSVYFLPVDDDLNPSGDPMVYATGVGGGYHDGLGIDACGNLYVPDFTTRGLYRVDTAGVVTTLYNSETSGPNHYGHGLKWGSGIGGWDDHAIYLPQPYDGYTVNEIILGVPSGSRVRTWNP